MILPITETLRAIEAGANMNLRPADIGRIREAHREVAEIILGHDIPFAQMQERYFIPGP